MPGRAEGDQTSLPETEEVGRGMPGGNHEAGVCLSQGDPWGVPAALDPLYFLRGHREGPQYSECPYHPETKGLIEGTTGGVGCLS